jgi:hypothetical protein
MLFSPSKLFPKSEHNRARLLNESGLFSKRPALQAGIRDSDTQLLALTILSQNSKVVTLFLNFHSLKIPHPLNCFPLCTFFVPFVQGRTGAEEIFPETSRRTQANSATGVGEAQDIRFFSFPHSFSLHIPGVLGGESFPLARSGRAAQKIYPETSRGEGRPPPALSCF